MSIITVGIDLAKNIFAVHGVNEAGKAKFRNGPALLDTTYPEAVRHGHRHF